MSSLCRHIANGITTEIPSISLGSGIFIGPPRPYEVDRNSRVGPSPVHVFINESGGLQDGRNIGTVQAVVKKDIQIVIRSDKSVTGNQGGQGAFANGMRMTGDIENVIRQMENIWIDDIKIISNGMYLGKHEDDMHYWSINLRVSFCLDKFDMFYGESSAISYDSVTDGAKKTSMIYSGSYAVSGSDRYKYVLIPETATKGFSPYVSLYSDGAETEFAASQSSINIDGTDYMAFWFDSGEILDGHIRVLSI